MKKTLNLTLPKAVMLLITLGLAHFGYGQMKIGSNPSQINKSSILELESDRQGLLLTRISDTALMTALNPPDGMIIYSASDNIIYLRSNFKWKKLVTGSDLVGQGWILSGNESTDSSTHFLGTTDGTGLRIGANNIPAILISRDGIVKITDSLSVSGKAGFDNPVHLMDSLLVEKTMLIGDSVTLKTVRDALPDDKDVLIISGEGIVRKMSLETLAGKILAEGKMNMNIWMDTVALSQGHNGPWVDSLSRKADSIVVLNIPDAALGVRGLVSDDLQSFGGTKSFRDSLNIGTSAKPNSTLQISGNMSTITKMLNSGSSFDMTAPGNSDFVNIVVDVSGMASEYLITLPDATPEINGRTYQFRKIGNKDNVQIDSNLKIVPSGAGTFEDGGTEFNIFNNFSSVTLRAEGGKWLIIR